MCAWCARVGACCVCIALDRTVGVSSADAAEADWEETGLGRAPQSRSSSGDGRGCRTVAGIGALMTNVLQFTGDRFCSQLSPSVVGSWSLSSSISPETERLRSLRVLQKQVARPQEVVGQRLRIILSREKAIESGWLGWPGSLGWAVRWLYDEGKKK